MCLRAQIFAGPLANLWNVVLNKWSHCATLCSSPDAWSAHDEQGWDGSERHFLRHVLFLHSATSRVSSIFTPGPACCPVSTSKIFFAVFSFLHKPCHLWCKWGMTHVQLWCNCGTAELKKTDGASGADHLNATGA